jgi:hypothetical protein
LFYTKIFFASTVKWQAMSEQILRDVPAHNLALLFVNGVLILILSPVHFLLPNWINPFTQPVPSEALGSIALVAIFAFILGIPDFLCEERITGNKCLIAWIKGKKAPDKITPEDQIEYVIWVGNSGLGGHISFQAVRYQIINAIILGSEIAVALNVFTVPIVFLLGFATPTYCLDSLFFSIVGTIIFVVTWASDKWLFKAGHHREAVAINKKYAEYKKSKGI